MVRVRSVMATAALATLGAPLACSGKSSQHGSPEDGEGGSAATASSGRGGTSTSGRGGSAPVTGGANAGGATAAGRGGMPATGGAISSGGSAIGEDGGVSGQAAGGAGGTEVAEGGQGATNTGGANDGEGGTTGGSGTTGGTGGTTGGTGGTNDGEGGATGGEGGHTVTSCLGWRDDCTDAPGCATPLDSAEHCGACGVPAPDLEHTIAVCSNETASPPLCARGFADCNLDSYDCETSYDSPGPTCLPAYAGSLVYDGGGLSATKTLLTPAGELYLAGYFTAPFDFDPGAGEDRIQPTAPEEGFVTQLAPDGSYVFTRHFVSPVGSYVRDLTLAPDGSLRVAGYFFDEVDLDPGLATDLRQTLAQDGSAFVAALSAEGAFLWGVDLPAAERSYVTQVSTDAAGNTWVAGDFTGEFVAAPSALTALSSAFVAKLDATGELEWTRVLTGADCDARAIGIAAEPNGVVNAFMHVAHDCELTGSVVPALARGRSALTPVLFRFDAGGELLSAGALDPADSASAAHVWTTASGANGALFALGSLRGKADFDPTDGVDFRGASNPTGFLARFDAAELSWMQATPGHDASALSPLPNGGALLAAFRGNGNDMSIFGFSPDSRALFTLDLDPKLELYSVAANADGFALAVSYADAADLDPTPGTDIMIGDGFAVSRFSFASP